MNLELIKEISLLNPTQLKPTNTSGSSQSLSSLNSKLYTLLKQEFNENILTIKLMPETDFMKQFTLSNAKLYTSFFPHDLLDNDTFSLSLKAAEQRIYEDCYKPIMTEIDKSIAVYSKKKKSKSIDGRTVLTSFHKHCEKNWTAYHSCKDSGLGRFINVYVNMSIEYVICSKCLLVYRKEVIPMYCDCCKVHFYSAYQTTIEQRCYPATWLNYHCKGVIPEQMRCGKCNSRLWLSKGNFLCCKQCNDFQSPSEIEWKCKGCLDVFRIKDNEVKEFNPVESVLVKRAIKAAVIGRQLALPNKAAMTSAGSGCNCGDKGDKVEKGIEISTYYHSKECIGALYIGELNGWSIIVCSKCLRFFDANEFNWICSGCNGQFVASVANVNDNGNTNANMTANINCTVTENNNNNNTTTIHNKTLTSSELSKRKKNISIINFTHYSLMTTTPLKGFTERGRVIERNRDRDRDKDREDNANEDALLNSNIEDIMNDYDLSKMLTHSNEKTTTKRSYEFITPQKLFVNCTPIKVNPNEVKYPLVNLNNSTVYCTPNVKKSKGRIHIRDKDSNGNDKGKEYPVIVPKELNKSLITVKKASIDLTKEDILKEGRKTASEYKEDNSNYNNNNTTHSINDNNKNMTMTEKLNIPIISIDKYTIDSDIDSELQSFKVHDELGKAYTLKVFDTTLAITSIEKLFKQLESISNSTTCSIVGIVGKHKQSGKLNVLLENITTTLDEDIKAMTIAKKYYKQVELQSMIHSMITAMILSVKYSIELLELLPCNVLKTQSGFKILPKQLAIYGQKDNGKDKDKEEPLKDKRSLSKLIYCVLYASTMSLDITKDIMTTADLNDQLIKLHSNLRKRYKPEFINSFSYIFKSNSAKPLIVKSLEEMAQLFEFN